MGAANPTTGREGDVIATQSKSKRQPARNGKPPAKKKPRQQEYEETPGWGSAFHRPDADGNQPQFTGPMVLDRDTMKAILEADGAAELAIWTKRAKSGARYLRVHLQAPYEQEAEDDDIDDLFDDDQEADDDEDLPF